MKATTPMIHQCLIWSKRLKNALKENEAKGIRLTLVVFKYLLFDKNCIKQPRAYLAVQM